MGLVIDPILDLTQEIRETPDERTLALRYCLAFSQSVAYATERGEYPRYPSETIMDGHGDCEDSAILFGGFARALDYECAFLLLGRSGFLGFGGWAHLDVGVVPSFPGEFEGQYYEFGGKRYYYCSCNGRGQPIGDIPEEFATPARILPVHVELGGDGEGPGPHRHDELWFCHHCGFHIEGAHPTRCPRCQNRLGHWKHASSTVLCPRCGDLNPAIEFLEPGCPVCSYRVAGPAELWSLFPRLR